MRRFIPNNIVILIHLNRKSSQEPKSLNYSAPNTRYLKNSIQLSVKFYRSLPSKDTCFHNQQNSTLLENFLQNLSIFIIKVGMSQRLEGNFQKLQAPGSTAEWSRSARLVGVKYPTTVIPPSHGSPWKYYLYRSHPQMGERIGHLHRYIVVETFV